MVRIRNPVAQTPAVIASSGKVGTYSVMVSKGLGIKPVMTKVIPFSIHRETNTSTQPIARVFSFLRSGGHSNMSVATTASITNAHVYGTRFPYPCMPTKV